MVGMWKFSSEGIDCAAFYCGAATHLKDLSAS